MTENNQSQPPDLAALRGQIDALDRQIVELLNQRATVVVDIGKAKHFDGTPIYAPDREQAVLQRISELNNGPLPEKTLRAIYRELMSGSFALEKPLRIGYLGPAGSFSHLASMRKFGASVEHLPLPDIRAVFDEVARGHCDLGLVPIENSLGGGIVETMDSFLESDLTVCAEIRVEIHHNLLANCPPEKVRLVASKPEVFAQCRNWLSTGLTDVELVPVASSSRAAEMASSEQNLAAIGSELAAELYGLKIVFANIEDNPNNQTRFFIIGRKKPGPTGQDKTSILFTTPHESGALAKVLNIFAENGVNLTSIDNRPSKRRNWEYYFFVDAEGHVGDDNVSRALGQARDVCSVLHVLGSYPRANTTI
jgi:chorismate mutase/prephenate dehydratase